MTEAKTPTSLVERDLLLALLLVVGMQMVVVQGFSLLGALQWAWPLQALLWLAFAAWKLRLLSRRPEECARVVAAWRAPWPWMIVGLLVLQIALYPPMMHDSLSYRLPRMFLALQEGSLGEARASDGRVHTMPWGWESLALPFASLNLLNGSRLIGLICWMVIYQILFRFASLGGGRLAAARWMALALASAPFLLIQASSSANDILVAALLLVGVSLMFDFHRNPSGGSVLGSLLALVMAANVKPQFLVLGLPWLLWWALAPGRPWQQVRPGLLAVLCPLYVLVSPLPVLASNLIESGSLAGVAVEHSSSLVPTAWLMVFAGSLQFLIPQFQLPVFPWADALNQSVMQWPGLDRIGESIPKFAPAWSALQGIDNANMGLLHFGLLLVGILFALRRRPALALPWCAGVVGAFWIACSQVLVATMARSFLPFLLVLLPLAARELAPRLVGSWRGWVAPVAAVVGLLSLMLNPSAPLWPARSLQDSLQQNGRQGAAQLIGNYLSYQARGQVAAGMLESVPRGEEVGVLIRPGTPTSRLWQPRWQDHRIVHLDRTPSGSFQEGDCRWLLIADKFDEWDPSRLKQYRALKGWSLVRSRTYLPNLLQGEEQWNLYHRQDE